MRFGVAWCLGISRWCFALVVSLGCFSHSSHAAPRAQAAHMTGMFDPECAEAIKAFADSFTGALLQTGAIGLKFSLFGPVEDRFDLIVEAFQLGVGTRFRGDEWNVVFKTDGDSARFEVQTEAPEALCRELTAIHTLSLMGPGRDDESEPVTLSDFLKRAKDALSQELAELRRAALDALSGIWEEVVSELRGLFPGSTPGTIGGGGGGGGGGNGIDIGEVMPDFAEIAIEWKKKGLNVGVTIFEADEQSLACEVTCNRDLDVGVRLIYRNELAPDVLMRAEAYTDENGSGLMITIQGGF